MQTVITLLEAAAPDLLDRCLAVRQEVFTREMGVPADVERDSRDCLDGECRHFLITRDGRDIGAVRCLPQEDGTLRLNYLSDHTWSKFGGFAGCSVEKTWYLPPLISNTIIFR